MSTPASFAPVTVKCTTVESPVSDHPKCKDRVVAYGWWSFTRIEPQGPLPRRGPDTSTLWKIIYCMQCPS